MSQDPLTAFVARSLRADVTDVRSEVVAKNTTLELERIRFRQEGDERSLVVKRVHFAPRRSALMEGLFTGSIVIESTLTHLPVSLSLA